MTETYVIGLDIGTTSVKAIAFTKKGIILSEVEKGYPLYTKYPNWAEQDPLVIEEAAISSIRDVIKNKNLNPKQLLGIGISSAMHSLICVDKDFTPLSPSIIFADTRAASEAKAIKELHPELYTETGTPIHPMTPFTKLLWMKQNEYEPYKKAAQLLSMKEFLIVRWFGKTVVDYSIAASSGMFNMHTLSWNEPSLQILGITTDMLSTPVPPTEILIGLKKSVADEMGISQFTPFIIGSSDGHLANLGVGAIEPGDLAITIGTSGAVRQMVDSMRTDKKGETFCYPFMDGLFLIGGATNNGALVLQWLQQLTGNHLTIESMLALAEKAPPGAEELLFLPYINGERAPMWSPSVKGSYFGLSIRHKQEHLIRAALEGVIYSIYNISQSLEKLTGLPRKILAGGGFSKSNLWLQILADVFAHPVEVPLSHQSSAWGAAWLALFSLGEVSSLKEIKNHIPIGKVIEPNKENHQIYQKSFQVFQELTEFIARHYDCK